jgi:hypothetical protein
MGASRSYFVGLTNTDDTSLPVELVAITAQASGSSAILGWTTATETDNFGFEIERRSVSDSRFQGQGVSALNLELETWNRIGFVPGSGTSTSPKDYSFADGQVSPGRYAYRIKQIDHSSAFTYTSSIEVEIGLAPKEFTLSQNYPNPFNPTTTIEFTLPADGHVKLDVYTIQGQVIATLVNEERKAGVYHQVLFDASPLASGLYFSRLEVGGTQLVRRMVLMK